MRESSAKASPRLLLLTKGPRHTCPPGPEGSSTSTAENPATSKPHPAQHPLSLQPCRSWGRGSHETPGNASEVKL